MLHVTKVDRVSPIRRPFDSAPLFRKFPVKELDESPTQVAEDRKDVERLRISCGVDDGGKGFGSIDRCSSDTSLDSASCMNPADQTMCIDSNNIKELREIFNEQRRKSCSLMVSEDAAATEGETGLEKKCSFEESQKLSQSLVKEYWKFKEKERGGMTRSLSESEIYMKATEVNVEKKGHKKKSTERPKSLFFSQSTRRLEEKTIKSSFPKNAERLRQYLENNGLNINNLDSSDNEDSPLHAIVRSNLKNKAELLLVLMMHSSFGSEKIDKKGRDGNAAIHIAVMENDVHSMKILLVFGANINLVNGNNQTPLDVLASEGWNESNHAMWEVLYYLNAIEGAAISIDKRCSFLASFSMCNSDFQVHSLPLPEPTSRDLAYKLETNMNEMFHSYQKIQDADLQLALGLQHFELKGWKVTGECPLLYQIEGGSRILFLDGGGIRGLIQIELLAMLEKSTGRKITDLFDWIVGTSTGAIIALAIVYAKKSIAEVRQLYFCMKNQVFAKSWFGRTGNHNNTLALESILKKTLGAETRMSDIKEPKVLVSAVNKSTTRPVLTFFNNCFGNEYSNEYVWKVARYSSAAPLHFSEMDGYIDGGILASNPSDYGLTAIQDFYQKLGKRMNIACVVSLGCGVFPDVPLGNTDLHETLFGLNFLNIQALQKKATNLLTVLRNAVSNTEDVVKNTRSRLKALNIPFYRFSPRLDIQVEADDTEDHLLLEMLMKTKIVTSTYKWVQEIDNLVELFERIAEENYTVKLNGL